MYRQTYTHVHTYIYTCTYIHTHTYTHVYTHIDTHINLPTFFNNGNYSNSDNTRSISYHSSTSDSLSYNEQ